MYTAGNVMDTAAALMNDAPKAVYTYAVQLPYLILAQRELEQTAQLNEVPLALISEYDTVVTAGSITMSLPTDFFLPMYLMERLNGSTLESDFCKMWEVPNVKGLHVDPMMLSLNVWDFRHNCINFIGATSDRDIRLFYWKQLAQIVDQTSNESLLGADNFLSFRTAALLAFYIGGNQVRTQKLDAEAGSALDRLMSILVKNNQGKRVRRHPFRVGRGYGHYRVTVP